MTRAPTKEEWTAALRSGKYTQTRTVLHDQTGFCCLGVYLDLVNPDGWKEIDGYAEYMHPMQAQFEELLSCEARDLINLSTEVEAILSDKNDGKIDSDGIRERQATFSEIADWIDTHDLATGDPLPEAVGRG